MATENPLDRVNYDFDDLVKDLQDRLKVTDAWKDIFESGTGQMLIELWAYIGNLILYYVERRSEECYLETAQNKSSIINLVKLLNYLPKRKISGTGNLTFSLAAVLTKIVYIPKYTECQTSNGMKYLTNESGALLVGQSSLNK